jgi:hypothetical protein
MRLFLCGRASPEDIRKAEPTIADRVGLVIEHRQASQVVMMATIVTGDEERTPSIKLRDLK